MHNFPEESFIIYVVRLIVNISTNRFPENPESWGQLTLPAKGKKKNEQMKISKFCKGETPYARALNTQQLYDGGEVIV